MTDIASLPAYRPRTFVPNDANMDDPAVIQQLHERLAGRPVGSPAELEAWLMDRSELESVIRQHAAILHIRMTCQTDDVARADAYKRFVQTIEPLLQSLGDRLDRKYLADRDRLAAPQGRYAVYDRGLRADVELFRQANVPLKTQESLLSQEYQQISGAMTVQFQGQERTLQQMGKFLEEPDRPLRESAWRATAARRLADCDKIEDVFDRMLAVRAQIAANAGCGSFTEYQFRAFHRFDYTPEDCRAFHRAVEEAVVPLHRRILQQRKGRLGVEPLRPWDTAVDVDNRPPLRPFEQPRQLAAGCGLAFERVDRELGMQFAQMEGKGLLDLASRKGKAPGGYQSTLEESRLPFIFMNAVGIDRDVRTLLHEGGHAFHAFACMDEPLMAYRGSPLEFAEVASMGMELLAGEHLDAFYRPDDFARSKREHLEGIIAILPWVATIDAFQHWIYANPSAGRDRRRDAWLATLDRFGGGAIDWTGLQRERAYQWHRQLHVFQYPFYYIEYGIAQLGALQLWRRAKADGAGALAALRRAFALGGSRPLPELFAAAGLRFDFSRETIVPLVAMVEEEL